jgi:alpha-L-fucosidase
VNLGRLITCAAASMKALIAEGAQVNGTFPPNYEAFNNFVKAYLEPIAESLHHTEGGGYLYGGLQPGALNDGGYGCTTISKRDENVHYVHVIRPPTTLRTAGQLGRYPSRRAKATATAAASAYPASNLTDGSHLTWWDNGGGLPVSITLDFGCRSLIRYLGINQREWSPVHPKDTNEASARIKDYQVYVSDDATTWTGPVAAGALENARAVRFIDRGPHFTRYVRLDVADTWATGTTTKYTNKLLIDRCGRAGPTSITADGRRGDGYPWSECSISPGARNRVDVHCGLSLRGPGSSARRPRRLCKRSSRGLSEQGPAIGR